MSRHAVTEQDDHGRVGACVAEQSSDRAVQGHVHVADRIAYRRGQRAVVARMRGIVDMPALMPHTVAVAE